MAALRLAYLDQAAEKAVQAQENDPAPFIVPGSVPRVRIAGIECDTCDPKDDRKAKLRAYQTDAETLRQKLSEAGVTCLAVVPTSAWRRISGDAGLYRFAPDQKGAVLADDSVVKKATLQSNEALAWRPLAAATLGIAMGAAGGYFLTQGMFHLDPVFSSIATFLAAGTGGWGLSRAIEARYYSDGQPRPAVLSAKEQSFIRSAVPKRREDLLAMLWPHAREVETGVRIPIGLPPAPFDVQENLRKAHASGFALSVEAVEEAILLPNDVAAAFIESRTNFWDEKIRAFELRDRYARRQRDWERTDRIGRVARSSTGPVALSVGVISTLGLLAMVDPIVTTEYGSATAIIVQYGDFPIEQALIDRVLNSSSLI